MDVVSQLRRSVRKLVRRDWPYRPLTESHVELLRLLRARPGLRVQEAAVALGLADNTVSTLVGRLAALGLVERKPDVADRRAARLFLTAAARRRLADWRDRRQQITAEASDLLSPSDRQTIGRAVPALRRLIEALEDR